MTGASHYYNEIDPFAAQWLRNLMAAGLIPNGDVDERSIADVQPDDVRGYVQCHFFAGIGGWPYALQLAGWPTDRPVWTGSCPCQPFSPAGKGDGFRDSRHLWPEFYRLIAERQPVTIFGEQTVSPAGRTWLDLVFANLESSGYSCGTVDLCAAGVGAPHRRQRLWFVAAARGGEWQARSGGYNGEARPLLQVRADVDGCCEIDGSLADADGRDAGAEGVQRSGQHGQWAQDGCVGDLGHASSERPSVGSVAEIDLRDIRNEGAAIASPSPVNGFWRDAQWIWCSDERWRPVEPGTFPLAHGVRRRTSKLRGYGNAIVPQVAAEFIGAFMECSA